FPLRSASGEPLAFLIERGLDCRMTTEIVDHALANFAALAIGLDDLMRFLHRLRPYCGTFRASKHMHSRARSSADERLRHDRVSKATLKRRMTPEQVKEPASAKPLRATRPSQAPTSTKVAPDDRVSKATLKRRMTPEQVKEPASAKSALAVA